MFSRIATKVSDFVGGPYAFSIALGIVLCWAIAGPFTGFSEMWQLVINTGTTIITFLMVFLIQHTQNNDTKAIQKKLDSLVAAIDKADNSLIGIEKKAGEEDGN